MMSIVVSKQVIGNENSYFSENIFIAIINKAILERRTTKENNFYYIL